jgi:hypothetical protein
LTRQHDHRQGEQIARLPERFGQQRREQHQQRAEEGLANEALQREYRAGFTLDPVHADGDQRRKDEQRQKLRDVNAKIETRHRQPEGDTRAAREVATEVAQE